MYWQAPGGDEGQWALLSYRSELGFSVEEVQLNTEQRIVVIDEGKIDVIKNLRSVKKEAMRQKISLWKDDRQRCPSERFKL